eukprot:5019277-Prymnesium_polylepis.1
MAWSAPAVVPAAASDRRAPCHARARLSVRGATRARRQSVAIARCARRSRGAGGASAARLT